MDSPDLLVCYIEDTDLVKAKGTGELLPSKTYTTLFIFYR